MIADDLNGYRRLIKKAPDSYYFEAVIWAAEYNAKKILKYLKSSECFLEEATYYLNFYDCPSHASTCWLLKDFDLP